MDFSPDHQHLQWNIAVGTVLDDRYEILEQFGMGGVGLVYRAQHIRLGLPVAVKVLQEKFLSHNMMRPRFEREARALGTLSHPNIVSVTDFGITEGRPYLVMELLKGHTLRTLLEKGFMPIDQVVSITHQILQGLAYAHLQGFVHRDLKPSNIYIQQLPSTDVQVKILDFGLVKFIDEEDHDGSRSLTKSGIAVGTPSYMAPEQVIGDRVGPSTDIYAMGILLFEMLTGHPPFRGELSDIVRQHLTSEVPKLCEACVGLEVTDELDKLINRTVDKVPENRYSNASEMLEAFSTIPDPPAVRSDLSHATTIVASYDNLSSTSAKVRQPKRIFVNSLWKTLQTSFEYVGKLVVWLGKFVATSFWYLGRGLFYGLKWSLLFLWIIVSNLTKTTKVWGIPRFIWSIIAILSVTGATVFFLNSLDYKLPFSKLDLSLPYSKTKNLISRPLKKITNLPKQHFSKLINSADLSTEKEQVPPTTSNDNQTEQGSATLSVSEETSSPPSVIASKTTSTPTRPAAHNPWKGRRIPRILAAYRKRILKGHKLRNPALKALRDYSKNHRGDSRPSLLLAQAYMNHSWYRDALERYQLAYRIDPKARGDVHMKRDLIHITLYPKLSAKASKTVMEVYGLEAIDTINSIIKKSSTNDKSRDMLIQLRQKILASTNK